MADLAGPTPTAAADQPFVSKWSDRYRGATVEDLDPPAALSLNPADTVDTALAAAFERDFTHLTVVDAATRALLGYVAIPQLQRLLAAGAVQPGDALGGLPGSGAPGSGGSGGSVSGGTTATATPHGYVQFRRAGRRFHVITMQTPLEQLEAFFAGHLTRGEPQPFAVITDERRRFVLGVATAADLEEFVKRRPA